MTLEPGRRALACVHGSAWQDDSFLDEVPGPPWERWNAPGGWLVDETCDTAPPLGVC